MLKSFRSIRQNLLALKEEFSYNQEERKRMMIEIIKLRLPYPKL